MISYAAIAEPLGRIRNYSTSAGRVSGVSFPECGLKPNHHLTAVFSRLTRVEVKSNINIIITQKIGTKMCTQRMQ